MKLSIIIPLYNKEKYIKRCFTSLLCQNLSENEYEIIVIDDGSTDNGAEIVKSFVSNHKNISYVLQNNAGPSAARNHGISKSKGEYLYFLDADDFLAANVMPSLLSLCQEYKLDILEFETKEIEEENVRQNVNNSKVNSVDISNAVLSGIGYINKNDFRNQAWHYFIKREFLEESGIIFPEHMYAYEDLIFSAKIFLSASRTAKVNVKAHRYVKVAGSIVRSKDPEKNMEFVNGMITGVKELYSLILDLRRKPREDAEITIKRLRGKQFAIVLALFIKVFKYRLFNTKELKMILEKIRGYEAYPITTKFGPTSTGSVFKRNVLIPVLNNEFLLFCSIKIIKLFPRR